MTQSLGNLLSVSGPVVLSGHDSRATPGFEGDKGQAEPALKDIARELADLQERLFAAGRTDSSPAKILLVLQGMDTSGKGGTLRGVAGLFDPQGLSITSFKKPTPEELEHDFLWRVEQALPQPGMIGIFDRSHYEDVLIGRVRQLASADEIERRYQAINDFEKRFLDGGGHVIKCFLHISAEVQHERLTERLNDPTKYWKYNPGDLDERMLWDDYQKAYEIVLERCSGVPWNLIPAGRKWYRNWAVATLLRDKLASLNMDWPPATFNVEQEKARLESM